MFFYDLFLNFILCIFCIFTYKFVIYHLADKKYDKLFFSLLLIFMLGLILLYARNPISFVFLDIPIILGYLKNRKKDSLLMSILITLLLIAETNINPVILIIKYSLYLITFTLFKNKKCQMLDLLVSIKTFFMTFLCFGYYNENNVPLNLLYLLAIVVFIYFTLKLMLRLLNLEKNDYSEEKKELDKRIFRIAHEIKNPIAVCKGYLDMMDINDKIKTEKYIAIIRSEMNRALIVMNDFMSLSNISIRNEILDIYMLIEDVKETMENLLSAKNVKLEIPYFNDELYIMGDYDRLKQVLVNMIKNASEANATKILIKTDVSKNNICIKIEDNGSGITREDLKKIGEVFFTTKTNGNGIGVNLSKEIVSLHKGSITYNSKVDEGTTVNICLPIEKGIN